MLTIVQYVLLGLVVAAAFQVPPAIDCKAQLKTEQAQSATCPAGADGRSIPGIPGPPGKDCILVQFPNGEYGCKYADGSFSESNRAIMPDLQGVRPSRFWLILGTLTVLLGTGSWKLIPTGKK
jgi:hypothetical protein